MTSETFRLSEIANIQGGYAFKSADFGSEGIAVVKIANIQPPAVSLVSVDRVAPEKLTGLERFKLEDGDILMAMTGATVGKVGRFKGSEPAYLNQRVARISALKGKQFDDFIYAVASLPGFDELIEGASSGSAQANISAAGIGSVQIPKLTEAEQLGIGEIARVLDDRITLLRETNQTLEAIAQALFKSWFVDFDPVRAKAEGRVPESIDAETAALFPDAYEETELGLVPKGWGIGKLSDIVSLRNERAKPSAEVQRMPYVPIECIAAKAPFLIDTKSGDEANSSLTVFREGDILFGAMRPYFHKVCIAPFDGVTRTTVFPLKVNFEKERGYALFCVYQNTTIDFATQHSEGSTIPYAKWKGSLELMQCLIPPRDLREKYGEVVDSFVVRANANIALLKTLVGLRDTLLPRLISGQLRIADAEAELEKATA